MFWLTVLLSALATALALFAISQPANYCHVSIDGARATLSGSCHFLTAELIRELKPHTYGV